MEIQRNIWNMYGNIKKYREYVWKYYEMKNMYGHIKNIRNMYRNKTTSWTTYFLGSFWRRAVFGRKQK